MRYRANTCVKNKYGCRYRQRRKGKVNCDTDFYISRGGKRKENDLAVRKAAATSSFMAFSPT